VQDRAKKKDGSNYSYMNLQNGSAKFSNTAFLKPGKSTPAKGVIGPDENTAVTHM
jgi:hypothetical protein